MEWSEYVSKVRENQLKGFDVYIYGAGKVGGKLFEELRKEEITPKAFLVTDADSNLKNKLGVPVIQYNDIRVDKTNSLILVAIKKPWNKDVIRLLSEEDFPFVLDMQEEFDSFVKKPMILEITARIGCQVACRYCPQTLLCSNYKSEVKVLSYETFKTAIDKIPDGLGIAFSGFAEPFLNSHIVSMMQYANERGRNLYLNTTLVGMNRKQFEEIREIPFFQNILHLPDKEGYAHIPITKQYLELLDVVLDAKKVNSEDSFFDKANAQGEIDPAVAEIVANRINVSNQLVDRAGNLPKDNVLKTAPYLEGKIYCNCSPEMNAHVLLPNGDLALCCMDFGLQYIIGNILKEDYDEIQNGKRMQEIRSLMDESPRGGDVLCRKCTEALPLKG